MVESFPIVPASAKSLWFLGGISCLLVLVLAVLLYTAYASQHTRVEVVLSVPEPERLLEALSRRAH